MIDSKSNTCTGCGVCSLVCPKDCISMTINENGEYAPEVRTENCIECGKCERVCGAAREPLSPKRTEACYYGWAKDEATRKASTSGGVFSQIAAEFIKRGGYVAGAAFEPDFRGVRHIVVDNAEDLRLIRGSKYVESMLWPALPVVKELLDSGKRVLFSGAPCQVSALRHYLGRDYENLYACEVFCHGAPAAGVFRKYADYLQSKCGALKSFDFRSKTHGWRNPLLEIRGERGTVAQGQGDNAYHLMFGYHESLRRSCFHCKYRGFTRYADCTLGDFWGIEKYYPSIDVSSGVSAVFANGAKGRELLNTDALELRPCEQAEILEKNRWVISNYPEPDTRAAFLRRYRRFSPGILFPYSLFLYKTVYRVRNRLRRILNHETD